jgi:hypothetical protein
VRDWERQETRTAKRYRGSRSPGSGNGHSRKNDVRNEHLLIENKLTRGLRSITLKVADLELLRRNASVEGRVPVLQFDLAGRSYVVLHEGDFYARLGGDE